MERIATCPWDYTPEESPEGTVPPRDRTTQESRVIGIELAAMADEGEKCLRARVILLPDRCCTCALRAGSVPNGCIDTLGDVVKCAIDGDRSFLCHEPREGDRMIDRAYYGWLALRAYLGQKFDGDLVADVAELVLSSARDEE